MMVKKLTIGFCLAAVVLLIGFPRYQRPEKTIHRWKQKSINFYINREANQRSEKAIRYAFQKWDQATHFSFGYRGRNRAGLIRDGKNTVSFLRRWPANIPMNQAAWCQNWYGRDGSIVEADIILNMQMTKFTTLETNRPESYCIEGILAHEIGHFIGLGHIEAGDSVMKPNSSWRESFFKGELDRKTLQKYRELYQSRQ